MESQKEKVPHKGKSFLVKVGKVFLWTIASLIFLIILILILIQTPLLQNFARKKITGYLENKLKTKVEIGRLSIKFPTSVSIQNVFFEDQSKDTLLYGGEVDINISMLQLLKSRIDIHEITLNAIVTKIKRLPTDTVFNFQYIMDAFAGNPSSPAKGADNSSLNIKIERIQINNCRIYYKDANSGNEIDLAIGHLDTKISTFDLTHLFFSIPSITVNGLKGYFYQLEPLKQSVTKSVTQSSAQQTNDLQFINKEMNFADINVAYKSELSNLNASFIIGKLVLHPKEIDLANYIVTLKDATLNNSAIAVETNSLEKLKVPLESELNKASTPSFKITSEKIIIHNSNLKYDDQSVPHIPNEIDYSHLYFSDLFLQTGEVAYSTDTTIAFIKSASCKERSGFVLNDLATDFTMTPTGVSLKNLQIETPGSKITRSAIITYPSMAALKKDPGVIGLDLDLQNSKIAVKDILTFVPQLRTKTSSIPASGILYIDATITGYVNDMNFKKFIVKGLTQTNIYASGVIKGLPDPQNIFADITIHKFQSSGKDILFFIPKGSLPPNITLPESIAASGKIKGSQNNLYTNLAINTSLGNALINGTLVNIMNSNKAEYNLTLNARDLQLATLLQNHQLGMLTGNCKVQGKGYNPEIAHATFNSDISTITLNGYNYSNIKADGSIANKIYKINADINDPNFTAKLSGSGDFAGKYPVVHLKITVDSIKTLPLHLTTTSLIYHSDINGDFINTDPDDLSGNLLVSHSIIIYNGQRIVLDSVKVIADNSNGSHSLSLQSPFLTATIKGQYKLTQLANVFQQSIDPYFSMRTANSSLKVAPYHFSIDAEVRDNAPLRVLLPSLGELKPVTLNGYFANGSGWSASLHSPNIVFGGDIINGANITAKTKNNALAFDMTFNKIAVGSSISMYATTLAGSLQNSKLDFTLNIKDQKSINKYTLSGLLTKTSSDGYSFSLSPDNLLLNYDKWNINSDNSIRYNNGNLAAHNFIISREDQHLIINSIDSNTNSPLRIDFKNFNIATFSSFAESDSLLVNGLLNGNAIVKNIQTQPTFTTDFSIDNLSIYKDTIGKLTAKVNINIANTFHVAANLIGHGNNVSISGAYVVKPANSSFNFMIDIASFQANAVEGFTKGEIKNASGFMSGNIALRGSLQNPDINGKISFNNTVFNISSLNNIFKIDKEAIAIINNKGIELNNFTIRDTANNALNIEGTINTPDFLQYSFDLTVKAHNFQAINSTKKDNKLFYGKMVFSTNLSVKGTAHHPVINGNLSIDDKTNFTWVMPQQDPGVEKREGIVRFVDYSATAEDSLLMVPYDSLNTSSLRGYDVSINITLNKEAIFNMILDAANGDFLKLKGAGQLTAGIDASGKITLVGSYEINEGSYDLSFNFLKRKFIIQKGSSIIWTGEPTTAKIDVTAIYIANTAPLDLVQAQVTGDQAMFKQKLPFEVHLMLTGELLKPQITFDIILPPNKNYNVSGDIITTVQNELIQIRQDPDEINKQVFALLLLNRFVGQNPFNNSSGSSLNPGTFAMQSVSRILTEQLNVLTESLIKGVDINLDVASTQDYTTGSQQNRTDLNVGISKKLLSDRLTVTVGSDFELQGPQPANNQQQNFAGNISINYKLSKDGKYVLRAYRKNDYTDIIEGYVIETGIGFIISVDYNKFKEFFTTKEQRKKKREIQKANENDD